MARLPDIPEKAASGVYKGLATSIANMFVACYYDAVAQVIGSMECSNKAICLLVWDGSEWPPNKGWLSTTEHDGRPWLIQPNQDLLERAKGRMYCVFCYGYEKQLVAPIESGSWIFLQNIHFYKNKYRDSSALTMHENDFPRQIYRIDPPVDSSVFYGKVWQDAMDRTTSLQPLQHVPRSAPWTIPFGGSSVVYPSTAASSNFRTIVIYICASCHTPIQQEHKHACAAAAAPSTSTAAAAAPSTSTAAAAAPSTSTAAAAAPSTSTAAAAASSTSTTASAAPSTSTAAAVVEPSTSPTAAAADARPADAVAAASPKVGQTRTDADSSNSKSLNRKEGGGDGVKKRGDLIGRVIAEEDQRINADDVGFEEQSRVQTRNMMNAEMKRDEEGNKIKRMRLRSDTKTVERREE